MAALIPISTLDPESIPPPDKAIRAVVSLYWPYSSSTKQCALLLADRDFRLRSRKGQVRVRFTSASATAVAQGKVGIGDEVLLDLRGAQWASDSSRVTTPGKSVEGELVYRGELSLRVVKKAGSSEAVDRHLSVNESTPPPDEQEGDNATRTPARNTRVSSLRNSLGGVDLVPIYSSPAFVRRQRLSGNSLVRDDVFDPFADIDNELENEQPRKRQRISDVSSWRFAGRSPSPEKQLPVEKVSDRMDVDAPIASSGQEEDIRSTEQDRHDPQQSAQRQSPDAGQDLRSSPVMLANEEGPQDSGPLPAKLSPLSPAAPSSGAQSQSGTAMLPPPLPPLQMPEDPFVAPARDSQKDSDARPEGPTTPKLKAVSGDTLPLPSPFPQDSVNPPFESRFTAALTAATDTQSTRSASTSDDGVRLQINPTITALARQRERASRSSKQKLGRTVPANAVQTEDDPQYVYPDEFDGDPAEDTEEDEDMHHLYSHQAQSHAKELLAREGVKTRDWFHREDAAEVIEDMGEEPDASSVEGLDEDEDEESDEDHGMLSLQDEEIRSSKVLPADSAALATSETRPGHTATTIDDEALIDVAHRSPARLTETPTKVTSMPTPVKGETRSQVDTAPVETSAAKEHGRLVEPSDKAVQQTPVTTPQPAPVASTTTTEPSHALPPKTPAKTLQSLFGFGYGMDGTNDTPPPVAKPTPQSERDRIMKKTYSSLFGFKASPSPEKERTPAPLQEVSETEPTFGRVEDAEQEPLNLPTIPQVERAPSLTAISPPAVSSVDAPLVDDEPQVSQSVAEARAVQPLDLMGETVVPDNTQEEKPSDSTVTDHGQFGSLEVQLSETSQPSQSPPAVENTTAPNLLDSAQTHPAADKKTADSDQFGSLEVQLSDMSDDQAESGQDHMSQDDPLDSKSVGARAVQDSQQSQTTSNMKAPITLASPVDGSTTSDLTAQDPPESTDVDPASPAVARDEPFDDEALVASMLNDDTQRPVSTMDQDEVDATQKTSPATAVKTEPKVSTVSSVTRSMAPPPSSAPVRSLGSQKVYPPPPSTAPRPSQVEVIDLGSSDESSDAQSDDDHDDENVVIEDEEPRQLQVDEDEEPRHLQVEEGVMPTTSQPPRASQVTSQELMVDEPEDGAQAYSPTEVASSLGAVDTIDVEMQDAIPEEDNLSQRHEEPVASDAQHESFFEDEMEASGFKASDIEAPPQSQMSEAPSTQSRNIADRYHYFSFEATGSDVASSDDEDDYTVQAGLASQPQDTTDSQSASVKEEVKQLKSSAQSEVVEILSFSPPAAPQPATGRSDVEVTQSSEATKVDQTPEVQVAASSFVEDSMDPARQPETQYTQHVELHGPVDSQLSQPAPALDSQHRIESQPFETQLPAPAPRQELTSETANERLKVTVDAPAQEPMSTAPSTRKHQRNASVKDTSAPVRRSPRKVDAQGQPEPVVPVSTLRQTRSQRTASPEAPQVSTTRKTRSQRTATPETMAPVTKSFDSSLLTPEPSKPLRRSPRMSQAQTESFESIEEAEEGGKDEAKPARSTNRKSPKKSPELKRKRTDEEDISPPPKRVTAPEKSLLDELSESIAMQPAPLSSKKTPSKKSFTSRFGNVPEVISAWFSPRRSAQPNLDEDKNHVGVAVNDQPELLQRTSSNGIVTSSAYYTPLSNLGEKLNPSSQPGIDNTIDVLAVVADETKAPERAKGGPRDYFTVFKIVDSTTIEPKTFTSVDVFRPWHATLPVAKVGDIVLLRGFAVKSRKRQPYLLSTDSSAWLVWRFDDGETASANGPRRTRRSSVVGLSAREETKGPPVELGEEERQRAKELRAWWMSLSPEEKGEASKAT